MDCVRVRVVSKLGGTLFLINNPVGGLVGSVLHHENLPGWVREHYPEGVVLVLCYEDYWFDPRESLRVIKGAVDDMVDVRVCDEHVVL